MTEDGSIVINTKIRTDGIKAGTAEIEAGVHRAADRVNTLGSNVKKTLNNQIDSFVKLNDEYSTQEQKVESLNQQWWLSPVLYMEVWQQRRKEN